MKRQLCLLPPRRGDRGVGGGQGPGGAVGAGCPPRCLTDEVPPRKLGWGCRGVTQGIPRQPHAWPGQGGSLSMQQEGFTRGDPPCFNRPVLSAPTAAVCYRRYGPCHKLSCTLRRSPKTVTSPPILSISLLRLLKTRSHPLPFQCNKHCVTFPPAQRQPSLLQSAGKTSPEQEPITKSLLSFCLKSLEFSAVTTAAAGLDPENRFSSRMVLLGVSYLCFYLFFNTLRHRTATFCRSQSLHFWLGLYIHITYY